jgi:hypothetical protein
LKLKNEKVKFPFFRSHPLVFSRANEKTKRFTRALNPQQTFRAIGPLHSDFRTNKRISHGLGQLDQKRPYPGSTLTSIVYHIDVLMSKSNLIYLQPKLDITWILNLLRPFAIFV